MTTDEDIVQRYLNADGSLRQMPAKRGPRLLVLAHIAQRIPVEVELKEPAVNDALRPVSTDVAMLRRALVDETDRAVVPGRLPADSGAIVHRRSGRLLTVTDCPRQPRRRDHGA